MIWLGEHLAIGRKEAQKDRPANDACGAPMGARGFTGACRPEAKHHTGCMSPLSAYLVEATLALPPAEREALAHLLLESVTADRLSDEAVCGELTARLARLESGEDKGLTFEEVFGERV